MKLWHKISLVFCVGLTGLAAFTCIRIEVFNASMGGYLPAKELRDDGSVAPWREIAKKTLREIMENTIRKKAELDSRPFVITPEQEKEIEEACAKEEVNAQFRDFVSGFGCLQYIIAPLALWLGGLLACEKVLRRRVRIFAGGMAALSVVCIVLMFYRGYFSSLGW